MAVNIYDIAKKSGLSVVTVSRVLNNHPKVKESNRIKVEAAIKELDYKPNAAARTLSSGITGNIALVIPGLSDYFLAKVMYSVEKELRNNGMFMVVTHASTYKDFTESIYAKLFMEGRVDGILILTPILDNSFLLECKRRNIPVVLLDQYQQNISAPSVTVDNYYGGYEATCSLIKGGAKRIAHISGPDKFQCSAERINGYRKALVDHNIEFSEDLLVKGDFSISAGSEAMKNWIASGNIPDAVFAADDNTAFGVINTAMSNNIRIPQDLMVIGYDNHPFDSLIHPTISSVNQPTEEMGSIGVDLLLSIIHKKPRRLSKYVLKPSIILRESTNN